MHISESVCIFVENKGYMTTKQTVNKILAIDILNRVRKWVIDEDGKIPYWEKVEKIKKSSTQHYYIIIDQSKDYFYICDK